MVEVATSTLAAVGAGAGALVMLLVVLLVRSHRRAKPVARRVASVAARLEGPGAAQGTHGDEHDEVSRLERLAEQAVLRASDAEEVVSRFTGTLDGFGVGVVICDEQGQVIYRNEIARGLAEGDELVGVGMDEVLQAALRGERRSRALELFGPPRRSLAVAGRPLDDGRRMVGAAVTIEDVSERRRLDSARRDFVANLTAELKTPVAALGLLAETIVGEDDPVLTRRLAERLTRDSLQVGRMIDDLVELSRLDAKVLPVLEPVPVHLLVAQAIEEIRYRARSRSIAVTASTVPPALSVVGDRRQLVSGLRHLIDNAVRFSGTGAQVEIDIGVDDGWVELSVRDRGKGIPAGELDRIFECFYRVDPARGRDSAGIGIGLAIASQVAAGHGGELTVESEEAVGSTFTLRLPAGPGAHARPVREAG